MIGLFGFYVGWDFLFIYNFVIEFFGCFKDLFVVSVIEVSIILVYLLLECCWFVFIGCYFVECKCCCVIWSYVVGYSNFGNFEFCGVGNVVFGLI